MCLFARCWLFGRFKVHLRLLPCHSITLSVVFAISTINVYPCVPSRYSVSTLFHLRCTSIFPVSMSASACCLVLWLSILPMHSYSSLCFACRTVVLFFSRTHSPGYSVDCTSTSVISLLAIVYFGYLLSHVLPLCTNCHLFFTVD